MATKWDVRPDGCWHWLGTINHSGYGYISVNGVLHMAHRVAYEQAVGPIPPGLVLDHVCHDPASCVGGKACLHRRCVNPDHLNLTTRGENTRRGGNTVKTHCKRGHEYTPENTYRHGNARYCRECNRVSHEQGRNK